MKKPLCRLCATHHYSHEPHNFAATDEAPAEEVAVVEKRRVDDVPRLVKVNEAREQVEVVRDVRKAMVVAKTIAERSRTYRANLGDEYRTRNRLRMARIRGSPKPE